MPNLLESLPLLKPQRRRAPWRQRLIDAERGFTQGIRGDGTLFFHLFVNCAVLAIGCVLDLSFTQWLLVGLAVTLVLALELVKLALQLLVEEVRSLNPAGRWEHILHLATAAVTLAFLGGSTIVALIYWQRASEMFSAG